MTGKCFNTCNCAMMQNNVVAAIIAVPEIFPKEAFILFRLKKIMRMSAVRIRSLVNDIAGVRGIQSPKQPQVFILSENMA